MQDTPSSDSLYAQHEKIYPREVHGIFALWRTISMYALLGIYYITPWLSWDDRQAVLLDLPERKFHLFGITFWPQDFFYFALLLIIAAMSLFFFTAIAGRLWCGYACPQTVWTEIFLWFERKLEGTRNQQMKLDKAPWTSRKILIKSSKQFVWITFSIFTGFTFIGYFTPINELGMEIYALNLGPWETFWIIFYSFATYGNAGFLREQVCIYMCPYARFQSAMFDKDTLVISYDKKRGDPRGSRRRDVNPRDKGIGDCIDCKLCVQVCPTGIDIRDGLQYQCIGCSACIDVCNSIMDKMGYKKDLVHYTTTHAEEGGKKRIIRPRIIIYALILLTMISGLVYGISQRIPVALDIYKDRGRLYSTTSTGLIENVYTLRLINMDDRAHQYDIKVAGINDLKLIDKLSDIPMAEGEIREFIIRLQADPYDLPAQSNKIYFTLQSSDTTSIRLERESRFIGPSPRGRPRR